MRGQLDAAVKRRRHRVAVTEDVAGLPRRQPGASEQGGDEGRGENEGPAVGRHRPQV